MADQLIPTSVEGANAVYVDVNPRLGSNRYGELVYDEVAVTQSIINLLSCPIGDRGRLFNVEYGSAHYSMLHEPMVPVTAMTLRAQIIQSLEKWEPRIQILYDQTTVDVDYTIPGYKLTVAYKVKVANRFGRAVINLPVGGSR